MTSPLNTPIRGPDRRLFDQQDETKGVSDRDQTASHDGRGPAAAEWSGFIAGGRDGHSGAVAECENRPGSRRCGHPAQAYCTFSGADCGSFAVPGEDAGVIDSMVSSA